MKYKTNNNNYRKAIRIIMVIWLKIRKYWWLTSYVSRSFLLLDLFRICYVSVVQFGFKTLLLIYICISVSSLFLISLIKKIEQNSHYDLFGGAMLLIFVGPGVVCVFFVCWSCLWFVNSWLPLRFSLQPEQQ